MAQQAQRSSIELFTHLYFKNKSIQEPAYIIKSMSSGIVTLIPKFGIEGFIPIPVDSDVSGRKGLGLFEKVQIDIRVEEVEAGQIQKLVIRLVDSTSGDSDSTKSKRKLEQ